MRAAPCASPPPPPPPPRLSPLHPHQVHRPVGGHRGAGQRWAIGQCRWACCWALLLFRRAVRPPGCVRDAAGARKVRQLARHLLVKTARSLPRADVSSALPPPPNTTEDLLCLQLAAMGAVPLDGPPRPPFPARPDQRDLYRDTPLRYVAFTSGWPRDTPTGKSGGMGQRDDMRTCRHGRAPPPPTHTHQATLARRSSTTSAGGPTC